ncbi:hypothetical protein MMC30_008430 [Trapelia coarctata]|nr:hypothetical protein [Trapelia coarctata]
MSFYAKLSSPGKLMSGILHLLSASNSNLERHFHILVSKCAFDASTVMQWRLTVQRVARKVLSTPPDASRRVVSHQNSGPEDTAYRILKVASRLHPNPEHPPFQEEEPKITESKPTSVQKKKVPDNEDILNLLEDIKVDLDFQAAEAEYAEDSSNASTRRGTTPKTSRGTDSYTKRGSTLSDLEQLPLSPLMHPRLLEARSRFTKAKPLPSEELNEFQRLININPYAKALATPVRVCILTGVRLPNSFFIPFTLKKDPRTGKLWQIPTGLHDCADQALSSKEDGDESEKPTESSFRKNKKAPPIPLDWEEHQSPTDDRKSIAPTDEFPVTQDEDLSSLPPIPTRKPDCAQLIVVQQQPPALPSTLQKAYLLSSHAALAHVSTLPRGSLMRILPFRWKGHLGEALRSSVWRQDMADFVLALLRKRVVNWLLSVDRPISISDRQVAEGAVPKDLAALIWLRDPWSEGGDEVVKQKVKLVSEPPLGAMVRGAVDGQGLEGGAGDEGQKERVDGAMVPVFNLPILLSKEGMSELWRGKESYFHRRRYGMLGLYKSKLSSRLVGMLWGLMRYAGNGEVEVREWVKP